jgi:hypothetical protein
MKLRKVATETVRPNPWNPNVLTDRVRAALRESVELYGHVDPVTVRTHPTEEGAVEIIDGEHRYLLAVEDGDAKLDVIDLGVVEDDKAKKLTVILNQTRGEPNAVDLAVLLADLAERDEQYGLGLPYDDRELADLLAMASADWEELLKPMPDPVQNPWAAVKLSLAPDVLPLFTQALDKYYDGRDRHEEDSVAAGLMVEALVADYLAS